MSPVGYVRKLGSASVAGGTAYSRQYSEKVLLSSPRQLPVSQQSTPGEPHVVPLKRQPVRAQNRPAQGVGTQMSCPRPAGTSQPLPFEGTDAQVPVAVEQNSVAAHSAFAEQAACSERASRRPG
jgi:hypothetical protein